VSRGRGVRPLIHQLGPGFLAQTLANAGAVLTTINELPALRQDAVEGITPGLSTIDSYTAALANLFSFNDSIAQQTGNAAFANDVRALSALSQLKDQASQQRAILYTAFVAGQFTPAEIRPSWSRRRPSNRLSSRRSAPRPPHCRATCSATSWPGR
jgi:Nitrate and nitrite sensing